jgi:hypothetical protein
MGCPDILKTETAIEQDTQLLLAEQTQQFMASMQLIFKTFHQLSIGGDYLCREQITGKAQRGFYKVNLENRSPGETQVVICVHISFTHRLLTTLQPYI